MSEKQLVDVDGDRDLDLYVVSGGSHETEELTVYQDRLYLNNGFGAFDYVAGSLPAMPVSGAVVAPHDFDGDGVYNDEDECPDTPRGTKVNDLGCAVERVKNITLKNINFYTGTAKMVKASRKSFNKAVRDLLEIKSTIKKVIVEGHTDSVGKRAMNQGLSQFRANTIRKLLISEVGFSKSQVRAVGHGEDRPVATNKTKKGRLKNRRVELRLIRHK